MKHIKKNFSGIFREKATTILLIIGFCLTFFIVINGIEAFNEMLTVEEATSESRYKYELYISLVLQEECPAESIDDALGRVSGFDSGNVILSVHFPEFVFGVQSSVDYAVCINEDMQGTFENRKYLSSAELSEDNWIIVGSTLEKLRGDDKKVTLKNREYEVIEVFKDIYHISEANETALVSMTSLDNVGRKSIMDDIIEGKGFELVVCSDKKDISYVYDDIKDIFEPLGFSVGQYDNAERENDYKKFAFSDGAKGVEKWYTGLLLVFAVVNCFFVSDIWVAYRMKEYAIKRAFGMSAARIFLDISGKMLPLALMSLVIALCVQAGYLAVMGLDYDIHYVEDMLMILAAMGVIIISASIVPLIRILRLKPADSIKTL